MRTGNKSNDDLLLPPKTETPPPLPSMPPRTHQPQTPVAGQMSMQPMPANVMSPDEMLRAYAERRAMTSPTPTVTTPVTAHYNGNAMRTLYSPDTQTHPSIASVYPSPANRKSLAPTEYSKYDDEDAYA